MDIEMTTTTDEEYMTELKQAVKDYGCKDAKEFEGKGFLSEFADSYVDIYTSDLLDWVQAGDNLYYADQALDEYEPKDFIQLLQMAQGMFYYERFNELINEIIANE